jgi:hypothetical protein
MLIIPAECGKGDRWIQLHCIFASRLHLDD